jgi:hypothetical protein
MEGIPNKRYDKAADEQPPVLDGRDDYLYLAVRAKDTVKTKVNGVLKCLAR